MSWTGKANAIILALLLVTANALALDLNYGWQENDNETTYLMIETRDQNKLTDVNNLEVTIDQKLFDFNSFTKTRKGNYMTAISNTLLIESQKITFFVEYDGNTLQNTQDLNVQKNYTPTINVEQIEPQTETDKALAWLNENSFYINTDGTSIDIKNYYLIIGTGILLASVWYTKRSTT